MAFVSVNKELTATVKRIVENMRDVERAVDPRPEINPDLRDGAWAFLLPVTWGVLAGTTFFMEPSLRMPDHTEQTVALDVRDSSDVYSTDPEGNVVVMGPGRLTRAECETICIEVPKAAVHMCIDRSTHYISGTMHNLEVTQATHPLIRARIEWMRRDVEVKVRWSKISDQVTGFLDNCKSVNEALKLWPDIERYLPRDIVAKARQVKAATTSKPAKPISDARAKLAAMDLDTMDLDTITSSAVLVRMVAAA